VRVVWAPFHWISLSLTTAASASRTESRAGSAEVAGPAAAGDAAPPAVRGVASAGGSPPLGGWTEVGRQTHLRDCVGRCGESERGRLGPRSSERDQAEEEEPLRRILRVAIAT
jgi:hypothetical protein